MTNARVVTYDIADGRFDFYTKEGWQEQLCEWRQEIEDSGYEESCDGLDAEEVVEMMWGEELYFEENGLSEAQVVTFDSAYGSFDFYTKAMWNAQLSRWREDLILEQLTGYENCEALSTQDLVEITWSDEMAFDEIPEKII